MSTVNTKIGARAAFRVHSCRNRLTILCAPTLVFALWLSVTHAGLIPEQLLVTPAAVARAASELLGTGELGEHIHKSLFRLFWGFLTGAWLGLSFGVLMGLSKTVEDYCSPFFNAIRQVPTIAFVPMLILIFGIEETFKIVLVTKATFFPVALASYDSVKGLPKSYFEVAKIYRCSTWALVKDIAVPATAPQILTGLRLGLGRSWMVLVAAEFMAAESGIGQMMEWGRQMFRMDIVVVGMFVIGLIGFSLDQGFKLLESRLLRWKAR